MIEFAKPDCPVCSHSMTKIDRNGKELTEAKRTCPKCKRRFMFLIEWHGDRKCEIVSERIEDYRKPGTPAGILV